MFWDVTALTSRTPPTTTFYFYFSKLNFGGRQSNAYVSMTNLTASKGTGLASWTHLIDVHLNLVSKNEKELKVGEGASD